MVCQVAGISQGVGSEGKMYHVWPLLQGVEQLLVCAITKITDGFLRDAI